MKQSTWTLISIFAAALLLTIALTTPSFAEASAQETNVAPTSLPRTITVVGEGKVNSAPDIARVNVGVEVARTSVLDATDASQQAMEAVIAALQEVGVDSRDMQTSGFSVYSERYGPTGLLPDDQVTYRVSNNLTVTVRDLDRLGDVLDASIGAGANAIYGVEYALDDGEAAEQEARAAAVEDAEAKAAELAGLNGVQVGPLVSISELLGDSSGYIGISNAAARMGGDGSTPVQPGQLTLVSRLQIVYEIAP